MAISALRLSTSLASFADTELCTEAIFLPAGSACPTRDGDGVAHEEAHPSVTRITAAIRLTRAFFILFTSRFFIGIYRKKE